MDRQEGEKIKLCWLAREVVVIKAVFGVSYSARIYCRSWARITGVADSSLHWLDEQEREAD